MKKLVCRERETDARVAVDPNPHELRFHFPGLHPTRLRLKADRASSERNSCNPALAERQPRPHAAAHGSIGLEPPFWEPNRAFDFSRDD